MSRAAVYLASDQASWITGVILDISGGAVMITGTAVVVGAHHAFDKTLGGTRGARSPSRSNAFTRFPGRMMVKLHRRSGDRFMDMDLLYLTTVGAKTGQKLRSDRPWHLPERCCLAGGGQCLFGVVALGGVLPAAVKIRLGAA